VKEFMKDCCGRQAILYLDIAAVVRLISGVNLFTGLSIIQLAVLILSNKF
jgi:hypothetical protein